MRRFSNVYKRILIATIFLIFFSTTGHALLSLTIQNVPTTTSQMQNLATVTGPNPTITIRYDAQYYDNTNANVGYLEFKLLDKSKTTLATLNCSSEKEIDPGAFDTACQWQNVQLGVDTKRVKYISVRGKSSISILVTKLRAVIGDFTYVIELNNSKCIYTDASGVVPGATQTLQGSGESSYSSYKNDCDQSDTGYYRVMEVQLYEDRTTD